MLSADETGEIAGEVLRGIGNIVGRPHPRDRPGRPHELADAIARTGCVDACTLDRSGQDRIDGHAAMAQQLRQGLDEILRSDLASPVQRLVRLREARRAGADVDDPAIVANVLRRPLQREECALGVDAEQTIEIGLAEFQQALVYQFDAPCWLQLSSARRTGCTTP